MSDKGKWIGGITALLGLLAAVILLLTRYQEYKRSSAEAELAEQRRRAETQDTRKQPSPPGPKPFDGGASDSGSNAKQPGTVVVPPNPSVQTIALDRKIDGPDPRLEMQLVKIDLEPGQRMRWHFTLWNRTGKELQRWWISSDLCHVVDESGNRSDSISTTHKDSFSLPIGEKVNYWIDFQPPATGARVITAHFKKFEFYETFTSYAVDGLCTLFWS